MACGYCFLNNAAIAATHALASRRKLAIFDVDVHHGNGTQQIFYDRDDVLFVSVHGDPSELYPYFAGYPEERGIGRGAGYTLNLPLPLGSDDNGYLAAVTTGTGAISKYQPDLLIVSLGLDFSEDDPFQCMRVTSDGFHRLGEAIGSMHLPTVMLQEGGYVSPTLGNNLIAFLAGFESTHGC